MKRHLTRLLIAFIVLICTTTAKAADQVTGKAEAYSSIIIQGNNSQDKAQAIIPYSAQPAGLTSIPDNTAKVVTGLLPWYNPHKMENTKEEMENAHFEKPWTLDYRKWFENNAVFWFYQKEGKRKKTDKMRRLEREPLPGEVEAIGGGGLTGLPNWDIEPISLKLEEKALDYGANVCRVYYKEIMQANIGNSGSGGSLTAGSVISRDIAGVGSVGAIMSEGKSLPQTVFEVYIMFYYAKDPRNVKMVDAEEKGQQNSINNLANIALNQKSYGLFLAIEAMQAKKTGKESLATKLGISLETIQQSVNRELLGSSESGIILTSTGTITPGSGGELLPRPSMDGEISKLTNHIIAIQRQVDLLITRKVGPTQKLNLPTIYYPKDAYKIPRDYENVINDYADWVIANINIGKGAVAIGYCDEEKSEDYNWDLGGKRSSIFTGAVAQKSEEKSNGRITVEQVLNWIRPLSAGKYRPDYPGGGDQQNRRVELRIITQ